MKIITVVATALQSKQITPHCVMVLNSLTAALHRVLIFAIALQHLDFHHTNLSAKYTLKYQEDNTAPDR